MRRFLVWLLHDVERHRKFQVVITTGVVGCAFWGAFIPAHQELVLVAGVMTNLIWIWEH